MNNIKKFREKAVLLFLLMWTSMFSLQAIKKLHPTKDLVIMILSAFFAASLYTLFMYLYAKWQDKKK